MSARPVALDAATRAAGDGRLAAAAATVAGELVRVDGKAGSLLGLAGAGLALLVGALGSSDLPVAADAAGWAGCGVCGSAVLLLAWTIRPSLSRDRQGWFGAWAAGPAAVLSDLTADVPAEEYAAMAAAEVARVAQLSAIALTKFRRLRAAVDLLMVGLLLAGLVPVLAVVSR